MVRAVAGEDTDSAFFLPVLARCLRDARRGEMGSVNSALRTKGSWPWQVLQML